MRNTTEDGRGQQNDNLPLQISDTGSDRKYFTVTLQLVWAMARTPYDKVL